MVVEIEVLRQPDVDVNVNVFEWIDDPVIGSVGD